MDELHQEAMRDAISSRSHPVRAPTVEKKARMECQKVRIAEVSRACQCLTGASVASGTDDIFGNCRTQVQRRELPREVLSLFLTDLWNWIGRRFLTVCAVHPGDHLQDPLVARTSI